MTATVPSTEAVDAVAGFEVAVDRLLAASWGAPDDEALLDLMRRIEVQRRRLASADAQVIGEVDARGLAHERGARDTQTLLRLMLRIDPGEARVRVQASRDFSSRATLSGERLEPALPQVAAALAAGEIGAAHARTIAKTIDRLPLDVQAAKDREIEAQLVAEARRFSPYQLRVIAQRLNYLYDQDGTLTDADRARRRSLNYGRTPDGAVAGSFELDPVTGEMFQTVIDARINAMSAEERGDRSPAQLRHDALRDIMQLQLRTGQVPASGGVPTTIIVTLTVEQWIVLLTLAGVTTPAADEHGDVDGDSRGSPPRPRPPGEWLAVTGHGALLTLNELAPLMGEAQMMPVVLSGFGSLRRVEASGDKQRLFSANQRLAMTARDRGCTFPGCTSAPMWCEAHHVIDHARGGPTSLANGALVCAYHHREFARLGYRCVMLGGAPHWIAPAWIDPTQTPQRNTAHGPAYP